MKFNYDVEGGEFINAGVASSKFKKILKQLGIPTDIIRKVSISMYEAEINMVIHADGGHIEGEITPERIYVALQDKGPGIADLDLAMTAGYSTASKAAREMGFGAGMGLPNIKRNSDNLKISSEVGVGTLVEIIFQLT
jgi:anti-sigma regulatory factor (Ser/Thr protein kinase)